MFNVFTNFSKIFSKDDSYEFQPILTEIEDRPINPLGRSIFWIIVFLIFAIVLILFLGKVDIVVSSQAKVIPDGNIKIVQPLEAGIIDSILVKEGDYVKKGQILVSINPSGIDPTLKSTKKTLDEIKDEILRLKADIDGKNYNGDSSLQKSIHDASSNSIQNQTQAKYEQVRQVDEQLATVQSQVENNKYLLKESINKKFRQEKVLDIIAKDEYTKTLSEVSEYRANEQNLNHKISELNAQKRQINNEASLISANFKKENLNIVEQRTKEINELEAKIKEIEFKSSQQKITSPVDGYINTILITTIGGVVTPAQQLVSIVPIGTPMIVKATVLNKDIGFIKEGMDVSIKVDTFDFQKYGMLKGTVKNVSKDSIKDEKLGLVYEVLIIPVNDALLVNGKEEKIKSGMTLTAEIKTGKRRIIEFFIYPLIKYLGESVSIR